MFMDRWKKAINAPKAKADGDNLLAGGQTVSFDGKTLTFRN
jgi:hypothetical protein